MKRVVLLAVAWILIGCDAPPFDQATASPPAPTTAPAVSMPDVSTPAVATPADLSCCANLPPRFAVGPATGPASGQSARALDTSGMKWIAPGEFDMGAAAADRDARPDERPVHRVSLAGYWIDQTPVTNAQFRTFVQATGYVTTAQKAPVLEEIMKQLPPGTPPPPAEALVAASMVFRPPDRPVALGDPSQWWAWVPGADWQHPHGPGSTLDGLDDHPVVQVSHDDAAAYAKWAGKRLPTEAEWERAARGNATATKYAWGNQDPTDAAPRRNTWQGHFPDINSAADGYRATSPVRAFDPNDLGLYDLGGNVWQWCADWYRPDTYATDRRAAAASQAGLTVNPTGPAAGFDPDQPAATVRVLRGGSYLCNASYCAGYRLAARMKSTPDTSTDHIGFRCAADAQ